MKTKKDGHRTIRFVALILLSCVCMLAMELGLTASSYADGASGKWCDNGNPDYSIVITSNGDGFSAKFYVKGKADTFAEAFGRMQNNVLHMAGVNKNDKMPLPT